MVYPLFLTFLASFVIISFFLGTSFFGGVKCIRNDVVVPVESKLVSRKFNTLSFRRCIWINDDCVVADSFNLLSSVNVSNWNYGNRGSTYLKDLSEVPDIRNELINL